MYRSLNFSLHTYFDTWLVVLKLFFSVNCHARLLMLSILIHFFVFLNIVMLCCRVFHSVDFLPFSALRSHTLQSFCNTVCFFRSRCLALALVSFGMLFILKVCILFEFRTRMKCVKIYEKRRWYIKGTDQNDTRTGTTSSRLCLCNVGLHLPLARSSFYAAVQFSLSFFLLLLPCLFLLHLALFVLNVVVFYFIWIVLFFPFGSLTELYSLYKYVNIYIISC